MSDKTSLISSVIGELEKSKREAANAGPEQDLRAAVAANPEDRQARFDLALALHAAGKVDEAVDTLLTGVGESADDVIAALAG